MKVSVYTEKSELINQLEFEKVTLPTLDGEITVLDNHNPIIGILKPGTIKLLSQEKKEMHIPLDNGFFVFSGNTLTIIVDKTHLTLKELKKLQKAAIKAQNKNIGQDDFMTEKTFKERKQSQGF